MNPHHLIAEGLLLRIRHLEANGPRSSIGLFTTVYRFIQQSMSAADGEGLTVPQYAELLFARFRAHREAVMHERRGVPEHLRKETPWAKETHHAYQTAIHTVLDGLRNAGHIDTKVRIHSLWTRSHIAIQNEQVREEARRNCIYSEKELGELVRAAAEVHSDRAAIAINLMIAFGLRMSDVLDLRKGSLRRFTSRKSVSRTGWYLVTTGKSGKKRGQAHLHYMAEDKARLYLAAFEAAGIVDDGEYIMCHHEYDKVGKHRLRGRRERYTPEPDRPMTTATFNNIFRRAVEEAGLETEKGVNTHAVRRSRITNLKEQRVSDEEVVQIVSISRVQIERYNKNTTHSQSDTIDTGSLAHLFSLDANLKSS